LYLEYRLFQLKKLPASKSSDNDSS
jgi:hypothetical protein